MPKTYPTYDIAHKKNKIQNFPFFSMRSERLAVSFKGLNISLAQSPGTLWSFQVAGKCGLSKYEYFVQR